MQFRPYLSFNGTCAAAFAFYERCFGGTREMTMTYGHSPMAAHMPAEMHGWIMHTSLVVGDTVLMGADTPPDRYHPAQGTTISIGRTDTAEAERVFAALSEGGTVEMPLQPTFWAARFGTVRDQFGTPWMVNCEAAPAAHPEA